MLSAVRTHDAGLDTLNEFVQSYIIDFDLERNGKRAKVRNVRIVDIGSEIPRLITRLVL